MALIIVILLLTRILYVYSQPKNSGAVILGPDKCRLNELVELNCCIFPPFFTRDVAEACGARSRLRQNFDVVEISSMRREIDIGCDFWACLLLRYDLLSENHRVVLEHKYFDHLDKWTDLNPNFATVMNDAKVNCRTSLQVIMPPSICEFQTLNLCIRTYVNLNCPVTVPSPECDKRKEFITKCKEYIIPEPLK